MVGGLYGVQIGLHVFCGESMFALVSNASQNCPGTLMPKWFIQFDRLPAAYPTPGVNGLPADQQGRIYGHVGESEISGWRLVERCPFCCYLAFF